jgi:hypothetical protein
MGSDTTHARGHLMFEGGCPSCLDPSAPAPMHAGMRRDSTMYFSGVSCRRWRSVAMSTMGRLAASLRSRAFRKAERARERITSLCTGGGASRGIPKAIDIAICPTPSGVTNGGSWCPTYSVAPTGMIISVGFDLLSVRLCNLNMECVSNLIGCIHLCECSCAIIDV